MVRNVLRFKKQLRQHQLEALDAIRQNKKGIINLPTGTGKTLIQASCFVEDIKQANASRVYVVLAPRIVLANQLLQEVYMCIDQNNILVQYLVVHSGHDFDLIDMEYEPTIAIRELGEVKVTTNTSTIVEQYERSKRLNRPLIICGTYHSAERIIRAGVPIEIVCFDEAQHLVTDQFQTIVTTIQANRAYSFTATLRGINESVNGFGMANESRFGKVIYKRSHKSLVEAGEIVSPELAIIDVKDEDDSVSDKEEDSADVKAIEKAIEFLEEELTETKSKLLVVTKGSAHLKYITKNQQFRLFCAQRPNLYLFDISSEYGENINGEPVSRKKFLEQLKRVGSDDNAEMIVLHIDILTEGIDVPGINGVLLFETMELLKFVQTVGRCTRLHQRDREMLYSGKITPAETTKMVKPFGYVITPQYGPNGEDRKWMHAELIDKLKQFDFVPQDGIKLYKKRGEIKPDPLDVVNPLKKRDKAGEEYIGELIAYREEIKRQSRLAMEKAEIRNRGNNVNDIEDIRRFLFG